MNYLKEKNYSWETRWNHKHDKVFDVRTQYNSGTKLATFLKSINFNKLSSTKDREIMVA